MLTALGFALVFGLALIYALARDPMFALFAYFAAFYVHPPSRWWGDVLPDVRWVLLAAVVAALAMYVHRKEIAVKPLWLSTGAAACFAAYCLWLWIQYAWALDPQAHWNGTVQYTKYLVIFYLIYRIVDSPERLRDLLFAHVVGCAVLGLIATFWRTMTGGRLDGVGGPGIDDANSLGMYLATGGLVAAALVLTERGWRRYTALGAGAFIANGFVLANSRGALLGLLAGGVVLMLLKAREHRRMFWVMAIIAAVGAVSVVDQRFIERMLSIKTAVTEEEERDSSAESRFVLYEAQLRMFVDHPWGAGYRGTAALSPLYLDEVWLTKSTMPDGRVIMARSSHNTYLTILVEQGPVGALIFGALLIWFAKSALAVRRSSKRVADARVCTYAAATCAAFTVVLVAGIATDYLAAEVQFWMLAALTCALQLLTLGSATAAPARLQRPVADGLPVSGGANVTTAQASSVPR